MGDVSFVYDRDGFLQQRGHDVFEYDSLGHLVKAYRNGRYEVGFVLCKLIKIGAGHTAFAVNNGSNSHVFNRMLLFL